MPDLSALRNAADDQRPIRFGGGSSASAEHPVCSCRDSNQQLEAGHEMRVLCMTGLRRFEDAIVARIKRIEERGARN